MDNLPKGLEVALKEEIYNRENEGDVLSALSRLNVTTSNAFIQFYKKYSGAFWSEAVPYELLDICDGKNNIEVYTEICRKEHGFLHNFLVLSELSTGAVLVLDSITDKVYEVDFEGGQDLLMNGELEVSWSNFNEFLKEYFEL
ncbi:1,3-beta-glucan synthase regulator [Paenibacillus ferrarius]|uniref:1,3-beta-glucan synthase regulator n=1 Tax=Paenibacillus ferrarius TaxID=1469647 RepID=A0A1V4H769_9BACL|nr:SMI1/KNR4 family protein [Paenibacillus ferrarius]OPH46708.1 1,3-beta-glucan synthase regulator [Paenibacillus ferrarius]